MQLLILNIFKKRLLIQKQNHVTTMNQRTQRIFVDSNILKLSFQKNLKSFKPNKKRIKNIN